eukprot:TRINITY_DN74577_c0_g1_i1.p1 TRINITY_DN74577_c0_g1~~TRINITY_DN74577_c0_g1_i1.p1  ORF type:complete len:158 (+),score=10.76 TRINITY_DN74577_c0_g1_i1:49-474(+)
MLLVFASLCIACSVCLLSSSAYRIRAEHEGQSVIEKTNASANEHKMLLRSDVVKICTVIVIPDEKRKYFGEGHDCPAEKGCGCQLGCKCPFGQSCYTKGWIHDYDENTKRLGHCDFAWWAFTLMILIPVMVFGCCMCRVLC